MLNFSVVIVASRGLANSSRRESLRCLLASLCQQDSPTGQFEVILVDSGANLGRGFGDEWSDLKLTYLNPGEGNVGPARGRNLGIQAARGEIIALTDDDAVVPSDWLRRLSEGFAVDHSIVAVGGLTLPPKELVGVNFWANYEDKLYRSYLQEGKWEPYFSTKRDEHPVFGGNIAYRKKDLVEVGLFDESFPPWLSGEDGDLKERLLLKGGCFYFVPLVVTHRCDYGFRRFFYQQLSRGASILRFRRDHRKDESRLKIGLRLVLAVLSFPVVFRRSRFDWRLALADYLSLVIRNVGKLYYYEKI